MRVVPLILGLAFVCVSVLALAQQEWFLYVEGDGFGTQVIAQVKEIFPWLFIALVIAFGLFFLGRKVF